MVNAITLIILIVAATRIYRIRPNGGVTDIATEVYEFGSHLIASLIVFGFFMFIMA
jgi:hypothetical protein